LFEGEAAADGFLFEARSSGGKEGLYFFDLCFYFFGGNELQS